MAVYLSISSREIVSKIIAIWWPTATFVSLALDHVVANMYFIPTAIFYNHNKPPITVSFYIWKSLIPTLLGNIVGGALGVAVPYWYLYLFQEETEVSFDIGGQGTAVAENMGPAGRLGRSGVLHGREVEEEHPAMQLPHSGAGFQSAVSKELSEEKYGKKKEAEAEKDASDNSDRTRV